MVPPPQLDNMTYRVAVFLPVSCHTRIYGFSSLRAACRFRSIQELKGYLASIIEPANIPYKEYKAA